VIAGVFAAAILPVACGTTGTDPADADDTPADDAAPDVPDVLPDHADDAEDGGADGTDAPDGDDDAGVSVWDGDVPDLRMMTRGEHVGSCMRTRACRTGNPQQMATCTSAYPSINGRPIGLVLSEVARCANAAGTDCRAIEACLTDGEGFAACTPLSTPDRCDGSVLRQCSRASGRDFVFDCARIGLDCLLDDDRTAQCGLGPCDPARARASCAGDTIVVCERGVFLPALCPSVGLRCIEDEAGGRCAGTGAACDDASDPRRCDGNRVVGCIAGFAADIDCATLVPGWTCGPRDGTVGCVTPGDECTAVPLFGSDIDESCDGEAVVSCLDGTVVPTSCADYGLGACTTDCAGGRCAARCTPP
jgi:hypothetical protein